MIGSIIGAQVLWTVKSEPGRISWPVLTLFYTHGE